MFGKCNMCTFHTILEICSDIVYLHCFCHGKCLEVVLKIRVFRKCKMLTFHMVWEMYPRKSNVFIVFFTWEMLRGRSKNCGVRNMQDMEIWHRLKNISSDIAYLHCFCNGKFLTCQDKVCCTETVWENEPPICCFQCAFVCACV